MKAYFLKIFALSILTIGFNTIAFSCPPTTQLKKCVSCNEGGDVPQPFRYAYCCVDVRGVKFWSQNISCSESCPASDCSAKQLPANCQFSTACDRQPDF